MTTKELIHHFRSDKYKESYYFDLRTLIQDFADKIRVIVAELTEERIGFYDCSVLMRGNEGFEIEIFHFSYKRFFEFEVLLEFDEQSYRKEFRDFLLGSKREELAELSGKVSDLELEIDRLENLF